MSRNETIDGWVERSRPPSLERRFSFSGYPETREFLERLAELSEQESVYPNLSFGRDYVNVTIQPATETATELDEVNRRFSRLVTALVEGDAGRRSGPISGGDG